MTGNNQKLLPVAYKSLSLIHFFYLDYKKSWKSGKNTVFIPWKSGENYVFLPWKSGKIKMLHYVEEKNRHISD